DPRQFALVTLGMIACLLYSIYCDPAFTMIPAISWSVAFATVVLHPLRLDDVAIRAAAIACCLAVLVVSGAAIYLYSLSEYSSRVQYAAIVDRVRGIGFVTIFTLSSLIYYFYIAFAVGLVAGFFAARGPGKGAHTGRCLFMVFLSGIQRRLLAAA